jgi:hypothetical protein
VQVTKSAQSVDQHFDDLFFVDDVRHDDGVERRRIEHTRVRLRRGPILPMYVCANIPEIFQGKIERENDWLSTMSNHYDVSVSFIERKPTRRRHPARLLRMCRRLASMSTCSTRACTAWFRAYVTDSVKVLALVHPLHLIRPICALKCNINTAVVKRQKSCACHVNSVQ